MKPEDRAAAAAVFGDRLDLATRYAEVLTSAGVTRGLIGPREVDRIWERHLLNCAVVAELLEGGVRVVDVGSGAGLPGLPLAIARPDLRITLVEPLLRRTGFLDEVVHDLGIDVTVYRGRAEAPTTVAAVGEADAVVSRAVAPLGRLMAWCLPLARRGGSVLAIKGRSAAEELARDGAEIARLGVSDIAIRDCGSSVLTQPTRVVRAERKLTTGRRG